MSVEERAKYNKLAGCVFAFDFFLTLMLYFLTAGQSGSIDKFFLSDVVNYNFRTSLFDILVIAFARALFLEIVYFLMGVLSGIPMAFSSFSSTVFLIVKACLFTHTFTTSTSNSWLQELVIFGSFLMPWVEAYVWFYRRKRLQKETLDHRSVYSEATPLLTPGVVRTRPTSEQLPIVASHYAIAVDPVALGRSVQSHGSTSSSGSDGGYETPLEDVGVDLTALIREGAAGSINADALLSPQAPHHHLHHVTSYSAVAASPQPVVNGPSSVPRNDARFLSPPSPRRSHTTPQQQQQQQEQLAAPATPAAYSIQHKFRTAALEAMEAVRRYSLETEKDGWELFKEQDQVKMYRKSIAGSPVDMLKGVGIIRATPAYITQSSSNLDERKVWDDMFEGGEVLEQLDSHSDACHLRFKGMWPVSGRDLCVIRGWIDAGNGIRLAYSQSVDHPACKSDSKYVRAQLYPTGFWLVPQADGSTHVTYVCSMDLKGSIPGRIKSMVAVNLPLTVHKLRKFVIARIAKGVPEQPDA
eukprot:TRINITY_DN2559_c0_g1_i1.p1 TRINITY_DN2559_c0_g1~~TRINITY_DN2559_c0_g1_i1.p1  ORF type:complete len:526 (+),score=93.76 TRINITY_DN2559_c0_g1_i1:1092-2669(+)